MSDRAAPPAPAIGPVGFIGLGVMGEPMALNLVRAGHAVVVHNRSRHVVERLIAAGADGAGSSSAVAEQCRSLITMLPDGPDVDSVLLGRQGALEHLRQGSLVIDMSTTNPETARRLSLAADRRGCQFLDAPVSGGDLGARAGTLSIMVGGAPDAFRRAAPLFDALGEAAVHVGPAGAGQTVKAANQMLVAGTIALVSEAITLLDRAGLDPATAMQVLRKGLAGSRVLDVKGEKMLAGDFVPGFRLDLQAKDLRIALTEAAALGMHPPVVTAAAELVERAVHQGLGALDHSALLVAVRRAVDSAR